MNIFFLHHGRNVYRVSLLIHKEDERERSLRKIERVREREEEIIEITP
jgi:hypothetical protein